MKKTMINEASPSYETPLVRVIALNCEGILCGSSIVDGSGNEDFDEDGEIDFF